MEPRELIYNVYKDITSIKTKFDDENLWCNPYKTIQGLTPMTPGYVISMEYAPHIDIEEYFSEEFIEKLELLFKKYQKDGVLIWSIETKFWFELDSTFPEGVIKTVKIYDLGERVIDQWQKKVVLSADDKEAIRK